MSTGEWEEVSISYRDHDGHYCACCGKQVPRRLYVASVGGVKHRFCSPDCADLYVWYWLPRYGAAARPALEAVQGRERAWRAKQVRR